MESRTDYKKTLSSTTLRKSYREWAVSCDFFKNSSEFQTYFKGYQAHHIIPREVAYKAYERGFITTQREIDYFDEAWNCIMISGQRKKDLIHIGSHLEYSDMVLEQIFSGDNSKTRTFLQSCMDYVVAMRLQMEELHEYASATEAITVNGLKQYLDEYLEHLAANHLCEVESDDIG